jgi:hypothetical protein
MSEKKVTKVSEEHLTKLQTANKEFAMIQKNLGDMAIQKHQVLKVLDTKRTEFQELEKELIQEYGDDVVINLESGEVKEAEKKEEVKE